MPSLHAPRRAAAPTILQFLTRHATALPPKRLTRGPQCGEISRSPSMRSLATQLQLSVLRKKVIRSLTESTSPTTGFFTAPSIGIDLSKRGVEVRKLFYAAFAHGLAKDGYDPEECLQEVYKGLLTRNRGTCPFDVRKSSFGHYVHIVTRCVLANYIRKERRRAMFESNESALASAQVESPFSIEGSPDLRSRGVEPGAVKALSRTISITGDSERTEQALGLLVAGYSKREVVVRLGVDSKWLDGILVSARATLTG